MQNVVTASKPSTPKDKEYIDWIKTLPCIVCLTLSPYMKVSDDNQSDPHHIPKKGHAKVGKKASDRRTIPLCHRHHVEVHQKGRETFAKEYSLDYEEVISRLNTVFEERRKAIAINKR
mgnify:CR=1 FL=1